MIAVLQILKSAVESLLFGPLVDMRYWEPAVELAATTVSLAPILVSPLLLYGLYRARVGPGPIALAVAATLVACIGLLNASGVPSEIPERLGNPVKMSGGFPPSEQIPPRAVRAGPSAAFSHASVESRPVSGKVPTDHDPPADNSADHELSENVLATDELAENGPPSHDPPTHVAPNHESTENSSAKHEPHRHRPAGYGYNAEAYCRDYEGGRPTGAAAASSGVRAVFPLPDDYLYSYEDTWGAPRPQGGHEGTDLMAPAGTPEYAVVSGTMVPVSGSNVNGWNTLGGYTVMLRADHGIGPVKKGDLFYYAHLDKESALPLGARVQAGQQVGVVGDTGQGPEGTRGLFPPHLHLGWYDASGTTSQAPSGAMNPYPLLEWLKRNGGTASGDWGSEEAAAGYCAYQRHVAANPDARPAEESQDHVHDPRQDASSGSSADLDTGTSDPRPSPVVEHRVEQRQTRSATVAESPRKARSNGSREDRHAKGPLNERNVHQVPPATTEENPTSHGPTKHVAKDGEHPGKANRPHNLERTDPERATPPPEFPPSAPKPRPRSAPTEPTPKPPAKEDASGEPTPDPAPEQSEPKEHEPEKSTPGENESDGPAPSAPAPASASTPQEPGPEKPQPKKAEPEQPVPERPESKQPETDKRGVRNFKPEPEEVVSESSEPEGSAPDPTKHAREPVVYGSILPTAFHDEDADGVRDAGEEEFMGWPATLTRKSSGENPATNGQSGTLLEHVKIGAYSVTVEPAVGYAATSPGTVPVKLEGGEDQPAVFGFVELAELTVLVCNDANRGGSCTDGDEPRPSRKVRLLDGEGVEVASGVTGSDGRHRFDGLRPGRYTLVAEDRNAESSGDPAKIRLVAEEGASIFHDLPVHDKAEISTQTLPKKGAH